jgi:hypothetical protein
VDGGGEEGEGVGGFFHLPKSFLNTIAVLIVNISVNTSELFIVARLEKRRSGSLMVSGFRHPFHHGKRITGITAAILIGRYSQVILILKMRWK